MLTSTREETVMRFRPNIPIFTATVLTLATLPALAQRVPDSWTGIQVPCEGVLGIDGPTVTRSDRGYLTGSVGLTNSGSVPIRVTHVTTGPGGTSYPPATLEPGRMLQREVWRGTTYLSSADLRSRVTLTCFRPA